MKKGILAVLFMFAARTAVSCTTCDPDLQKAISESRFFPNLLVMLSAFLVLALIVILLSYLAAKRERRRHPQENNKLTVVPLVSSATTLGIAFGGFIDGIFFHQILQWHQMLSNKIPPTTLINKSVNMFWDGVFHSFCLIVGLTGLYLMLQLFFRKDVIVTRHAFTGGLLLGWGIFNIVEGIIDHHLLGLHNVKEIGGNILFWNVGFLIVSVFLIIVGFRMIKNGVPSQLYQKSTEENP
jgi:uncharacterized membrane protein